MQEVEGAIAQAEGARILGFRQCVEEVQRLAGDLIELNRYSVLLAGLAIKFKTTELKYFEEYLAMFNAMALKLEGASIACKAAWDLYFDLEKEVTSSS